MTAETLSTIHKDVSKTPLVMHVWKYPLWDTLEKSAGNKEKKKKENREFPLIKFILITKTSLYQEQFHFILFANKSCQRIEKQDAYIW